MSSLQFGLAYRFYEMKKMRGEGREALVASKHRHIDSGWMFPSKVENLRLPPCEVSSSARETKTPNISQTGTFQGRWMVENKHVAACRSAVAQVGRRRGLVVKLDG